MAARGIPFVKWGLFFAPIFFLGCSVTAVRPSQDMSDMEVALRSALEVNAGSLAPELYRLSSELALLARKEYRLKNFQNAQRHANDARIYAERAEFEAIRNGAKRESVPADPLAEPSYAPEPIAPRPPPAGSTGDSPKSDGSPTPGATGTKKE